MPLDALILVVTGALLHALWNFFAKKASGGLPYVWLYGIVSITVALPFGVVSWLHNSHQLDRSAWLAIVASAIVHVAYSLVLIAMTKSKLSYVAPVRELSMLAGAFLGASLLRESFTRLRLVGMFLMVAGVVLLAVAK